MTKLYWIIPIVFVAGLTIYCATQNDVHPEAIATSERLEQSQGIAKKAMHTVPAARAASETTRLSRIALVSEYGALGALPIPSRANKVRMQELVRMPEAIRGARDILRFDSGALGSTEDTIARIEAVDFLIAALEADDAGSRDMVLESIEQVLREPVDTGAENWVGAASRLADRKDLVLALIKHNPDRLLSIMRHARTPQEIALYSHIVASTETTINKLETEHSKE